jgi:hypothetical protein
MKINEALKRIDTRWVRKPQGFRVRFNRYVDGRWETDHCPGETDALLDSDVTAWRLAWKLSQTNTPPETRGLRERDFANITVVNDRGERIQSYITGNFHVYHPRRNVNPLESKK